MLFGKKKDKEENSVIAFLRDADAAYIISMRSKNITPLSKFATSDVCNAVLQSIMSGKAPFSSGALTKSDWQVTMDDGSVVTAIQTVSHEPIAVGRGVSIPSGDTVRREWDVQRDGKSIYTVTRIGRATTDAIF